MGIISQLSFWVRSAKGNRTIFGATLVIAIIVLSSWLIFKREAGPSTEWILNQGIVAREIASGNGFSTTALDPYQIELMEDELSARAGENLPEMWQAPLYNYLLGGVFNTFGEKGMDWLFADPELSPNRDYPFFRADRLWLFFNLVLIWGSLIFLYCSAKKIWSSSTALLGIAAFTLSITTWQEVILLSESTLIQLLLALLLFALIAFIRDETTSSKKAYAIGAGIGLLLAGLFLTRYAFGLFCIAFLAIGFWHYRNDKKRVSILILALCIASIAVLPWLVRNYNLSDNPLGYSFNSLKLRMGDPTAEPEIFRRTFSQESIDFSLRKTINKGLTGWKQFVEGSIWTSGGLFFSAFFIISLIYPFKDQKVRHLRFLFFIPSFIFILGVPFVSSGEIGTDPMIYFSGVTCLFGAAFLIILLNSLQRTSSNWKLFSLIFILVLQALPLFKFALEPKRLPFHYPPYWPSVFVDVRKFKESAYAKEHAIVADIPAGLSWYGNLTTWAQPHAYEDFAELFLYENVVIQFFSPALLDRPFLSQLKMMGVEKTDNPNARNWGLIYEGIINGRLPRYYPLKGLQPLSQNVYVTFEKQ